MDASALDAVLSTCSSGGVGAADGALSIIDGKWLRGTRRAGRPARKVVEVVSRERAVVLGQREAPHGDEVATALALLRALLPRSTVYYHFAKWIADGTLETVIQHSREQSRRAAGREAQPTAAIIRSRTVKSVEATVAMGWDGGK